MAVEAPHFYPFSPQLLPSRDILNPMDINGGALSAQMGYGAFPLPGDETGLTNMQNLGVESTLMPTLAKPAVKSVDSTITSNGFMQVTSRKRPRENSVMDPVYFQPSAVECVKPCAPFSFLGQDLSPLLHQQQLDVDRLITQHMERVRIEVEEKRKAQLRRFLTSMEQGLVKRLRIKEEEVDKMAKLNQALEERMKSLCVENQIWRDLAHNNEVTANALRSNLEQVLAAHTGASFVGGFEEEDAESCCASSGGEGETVAINGRRRSCRKCSAAEASVLVLPCRHLCLCVACGSSAMEACPVCHSPKKTLFHINLCS